MEEQTGEENRRDPAKPITAKNQTVRAHTKKTVGARQGNAALTRLAVLLGILIVGISAYVLIRVLSGQDQDAPQTPVLSVPVPGENPTGEESSLPGTADGSQTGIEGSYRTFSSPDYPFTFRYPQDLEITYYSDGFGSAVAVQKMGPTQRLQTEFYDGISITFTVDLLDSATLEEYVDRKIEDAKNAGPILQEKTQTSINGIPGLTYTAEGLGEYTYVFVQNGPWVIGISNNTHDPTDHGFAAIAEYILGTFQLTDIE